MKPDEVSRFDQAVCDVISWGAVLDMLRDRMQENAKASHTFGALPKDHDYRVHILSPVQARAFDFITNSVGQATEELSRAYEAVSLHEVRARR